MASPKKLPNLWHLQAFRTALAAGSLSEASEQLGLTQPAVSQAVAGLERYYGADLAMRGKTQLVPTDEGEILHERSGRALFFLTEGLREAAGLPAKRSIQEIRALSSARLSALSALVRYGGFAEAARAIGVSAPSLHRAARDLEAVIDVELFEATSFGVKPSRKAETLARYAALAFSELRQAEAEIDTLRGRGSGRTVIGAMPLARSHLVPVAVEQFSRRRPDHRITILEGAFDDLLMGLRRGDVDILVGALRDDLNLKDVDQKPLFTDPLSLVMRAGHPAEKAPRLTRALLRNYPWVAPRPESPLRRHFDSLFPSDAPPRDIIECNSLGASRVILMNSDRLMLLSDAQIRYEAQAGMLVSRPAPGKAMTRAIGLTTRHSWRATSVQTELIDLLRRAAA